jgi:enoyl-CoA hydratase/carnithine racemase
MNEDPSIRWSVPGFFTTEDRGEIAVLEFEDNLDQEIVDLEHTGELWKYLDHLGATQKKVLVINALNGCISPATIDRLWERVSKSADGTTDRIPLHLAASERDLPRVANAFRRFIESVRQIDTFVIGTLQGTVDLCFFGLALACDYRIAANDAVFVNRFPDLNVSPGVVPWFLSRLMGPVRAGEFLLRHRTMTAQEALEFGLINRLSSPNNLKAQALAVAEQVEATSRWALATLKRSMTAASYDLTTYLNRIGTGFDSPPGGMDA